MFLKSLKLQNFQLFPLTEINPQHINLIKGINHDNPKDSSNGSGKSSLFKNAILFGLYGECGKILNKLIRLGKKECSVTLEMTINNEHYRIIRNIPSKLQIFIEGKEQQYNTPTIAQNALNQLFGDYQFFRKYCLIDNKGINLLDSLDDSRSIVSFKKELIQFIDAQFAPIRQSLLSKKLERENFSIDKKLYHFYLSAKRHTILESGLKNLQEELLTTKGDLDKQNEIVNELIGEINAKEREIQYKQQEIKKAKEGICPILRTQCEKISKSVNEKDNEKNLEVSKEIELSHTKIDQLKNKIKDEKSCRDNYNSLYEFIQKKIQKVKEYIMKLKEAQKFASYKFTISDIQLYADSIKVLDLFSGYFIQEWMSSLSCIINDLLKNLNLSISLTEEKEFIKIKDGNEEFAYNDLSAGQQKFFSAIFKLAILLQKGDSDKIIICDDGMGEMDEVNFKNFIEICQNLPMQFFVAYQDPPELENINLIEIERKNGESKIK